MKLTSTLIATLLFSSVASAHNVWLEPESNTGGIQRYVVKFGHEQTEFYPQAKLKRVRYIDEQGKVQDTTFEFNAKQGDKGEAVVGDKGAKIYYTLFNNGIWSKLPSGKYVEKTKREVPNAEFSINPIKLSKSIVKWDDDAMKYHHMDYELVPLSKPEAGKVLDILVLKQGKPVQGIKVGLGEDQPFNLSNAQGIAQFIPTQGFNKVWAEFEEKVAGNPDYSDRSYEYMLTFDVP